MSLDITVTDLFCGAGGSSIGAEAAGARLRMAANHWRLAIDTHNTNFPNADHDCADVSQVDPRRYPHTDILIASPECTNHSMAKSKHASGLWDPKAADEEERSRATMWDVVRFTEYHRYQIVVVENVVEARNWAPFQAWLMAMDAFGYDHRQMYLNSMVAHPTPQSRDRLYVVFWRRGNTAPDLDIRPIAHCPEHGDVQAVQSFKVATRPWGKYRQQYVYRCPVCAQVALPYAWPAAAAIDWSLPTPRIGDRLRPLAPATQARIRAGLARYGPAAIIQNAGHTYERPGYYRTWPLWQPLGTQTATIQHGLVVDTSYSKDPEGHIRPTDEPMRTQTARQSQGLLVGINYAHASPENQVRPVGWPGPTQTAQEGQALVVPMREHGIALPVEGAPLNTQVATASVHALVVNLRGTKPAAVNGSAHPAQEPLGPQTTQPHDALVVPLRTNGQALPSDQAPMPTLVAGNPNHALLMRNFTPRGDPAQMVHPVTEPTGTITAAGHQSLLMPYYGTGVAYPVQDPAHTVTGIDRAALVGLGIDIEDCGFRMLEPHEIGRAMAFGDDYVVLGNKRERVRQYGNAVTPPVMAAILERCIGSLAP